MGVVDRGGVDERKLLAMSGKGSGDGRCDFAGPSNVVEQEPSVFAHAQFSAQESHDVYASSEFWRCGR